MKKPQKYKVIPSPNLFITEVSNDIPYKIGYNSACEDWEKFYCEDKKSKNKA